MYPGFENKTGNIITLTIFSITTLLILINFFNKNKKAFLSFSLILFVSVSGIITLLVSEILNQKDLRIIFASVFIVANIFILSSLLIITFSKSISFGFLKSLLTLILIFFAGISVVFILVLNFSDDSDLYRNTKLKADAGVILGAAVWGGNRPSPVLRERINKGFDVYIQGTVPKLVITGGGSPNEMTEADVSKNVLIKYGVDPDNLIVENESNSTVEQIQFVKKNLYKTNKWKKIILISDNFHLMRAKEICSFNNIEADCIASDKSLTPEGTYNFCLKESMALIVFWMVGL